MKDSMNGFITGLFFISRSPHLPEGYQTQSHTSRPNTLKTRMLSPQATSSIRFGKDSSQGRSWTCSWTTLWRSASIWRMWWRNSRRLRNSKFKVQRSKDRLSLSKRCPTISMRLSSSEKRELMNSMLRSQYLLTILLSLLTSDSQCRSSMLAQNLRQGLASFHSQLLPKLTLETLRT